MKITIDNFSGLTVLSYDRGMMGEFYSHLLHIKKFDQDNIESKNNMWSAWKTDKTFDGLIYTPWINTGTTNFCIEIYGKTIHQMMLDSEYDSARKALLELINLSSVIDTQIFYNYASQKKYMQLANMLTLDDYNGEIITRYHNYNSIDITKVFPNCKHINFYTNPDKKWIFILLYFYKKIINKVFEGPEWLINTENDLISFFDFVDMSSKGKEIENSKNINAFDLLDVDYIIPDIFYKDERTKVLVEKNIKNNIHIINKLVYDINDKVSKLELLKLILKLYKENANELGRSY